MVKYRYQTLAAVMVVAVLLTTVVLFAQEEAAPSATTNTAAGGENAAPPDSAAASEPAAEGETAAPAEPVKGSVEDLWKNLLYYIKVAQPAFAKSYALGILQSGEKPEQLYLLTVKTIGWQTTLNRGAKLEGLSKPLTDVRKMIEEGYNIERADPRQIGNSIDMLAAGITSYELGVSRLQDSGEYALPQLIQRLTDTKTSLVLRERLVNVLPRMKLSAVRPLSVALLSDDAELQLVCANALGQIGYPSALPHLKELADRQGVLPKVKDAALRAMVAIDGHAAARKPAAELFYEFAEKYYAGAESMAPDIRYVTANVWYWKEGQGLTYKAVPREIFTDVYTMRDAALALKMDPNFYPAVSLWLAANLRKEADLPNGAKDPTLESNEMSAEFYALASSAKYQQDVLERGLMDQNSAIAVGAINALDKTAGPKNLVASLPGGVQPLVRALTYPDRQVRYFAAVTLAKSLPADSFSGVDLVPQVLNEALRQTGAKRALLVVGDDKTRNMLKDAVRKAGYDVIDEPDPSKALAAARASAGVDVLVMSDRPGAVDFINKLRGDPVFMALPAAVMDSTVEFGKFAKADKRSVVIEKLDDAAVTGALGEAMQLGSGKPLSAAEASDWAVKSADAIRGLGLTNNAVLNIKYTRPSLIAALGDKRAEVQVAAAGALAMMNASEAQRAIADLAVGGQADDKVRVAAFGSLSESIKKFGNLLSDEQAQAVLEVVNDAKASRELRNAAAAALGAMNLPSEKIKTLIPVPAGI